MTPVVSISLADLNTAKAGDFVAALSDIYEHSPWVAEAIATRRPFASIAALNDAMIAAVRAAPTEQQMKLIIEHPDLAGKAARAGSMTYSSKSEQSGAGLDQLSDFEFSEFERLNGAYRTKFGIPFIICVRRHTKSSILNQFEKRLRNDRKAEHETALEEIFHIAALRLGQRVEALERLKLDGRLTTHVLDSTSGTPGAGITVELFELSPSGERLVTSVVTNREGRTEAPLIGGRPLPIGHYELRFRVGDYFARRGVPLADPAFLDVVPIRFAVAEPEGHYHVPLVVTPWSYSTYRGS